MLAYLIRNLDPDVWAKVKAQAKSEGRSLRWVVMRLLRLYAEGAVELAEQTQSKDKKK